MVCLLNNFRYMLWHAYPNKHETLPNAGLMLSHRLRGWPNIKPALGEHRVCWDVCILLYVCMYVCRHYDVSRTYIHVHFALVAGAYHVYSSHHRSHHPHKL